VARKRYTTAFKDEACKLVTEQGYEVATAAKKLGVAEMTLRYWLVQRGWEGPKAIGLEDQQSDDPKYLKARVRDLEQRLKRAEMEREILKKATAYFANQNP
jgi:transposase